MQHNNGTLKLLTRHPTSTIAVEPRSLLPSQQAYVYSSTKTSCVQLEKPNRDQFLHAFTTIRATGLQSPFYASRYFHMSVSLTLIATPRNLMCLGSAVNGISEVG